MDPHLSGFPATEVRVVVLCFIPCCLCEPQFDVGPLVPFALFRPSYLPSVDIRGKRGIPAGWSFDCAGCFVVAVAGKSAKDIVCRAVLGRLRMPIVLRSLLALLLLCLFPCLLGYGGLLLGCKRLLDCRACSCAIRATKTRPSVGA